MPLEGVTAQNAALDAVVATFPNDGQYRLYAGLPTLGTTELASDGGYAPVNHFIADWDAADAGSVTTIDPVDFGTSTDAWSDVATYWAVTTSAGVLVYWDELTESISVTVADTEVTFSPTLFFRPEA